MSDEPLKVENAMRNIMLLNSFKPDTEGEWIDRAFNAKSAVNQSSRVIVVGEVLSGPSAGTVVYLFE